MKKSILVIFLFLQLIIVFGQYENALIPYRLKNKWGYCDINGNIKIKPIYEKALLFTTQGYAIIKKNGKFGIINTEGNYTCKPKFDSLSYGINTLNDNKGDYFIVTQINSNYIEYNVNFKGDKIEITIPVKFFPLGCFSHGLNNSNKITSNLLKNKILKNNTILNQKYGDDVYFYFTMNKDTFIYCSEGYYQTTGILNTQLKEILPLKYENIEEFEGYFKVYPNGHDKNHYGLYSISGNELLEPHDNLILNDSLIIIKKEAKMGVFNLKKMKIIIPVEHDKIILLNDHSSIAFLVSDKCKYCSNLNFKYKISYDKTLDYDNYINYKLIDSYNNNITDTIYKEILFKNNQDSCIFIANTAEGWNKYNKLGDKLFKESYNTFKTISHFKHFNNFNFKDALFIVSKFNHNGEKKYGVININDSIHVPFDYDELEVSNYKYPLKGFFLKTTYTSNPSLQASKNNRHGIITSENQILLPLIYKKLDLIEYSPFAFVELENGKYGYVNYITGVEYFKD